MSDNEPTTNPSKTVVTVVSTAPKNKSQDGSHACLVVIYGEDLGRRVPLGKDPTLIGRSSQCDIHINNDNVSRNHARIMFDGNVFRVRDLGSTNGTYVNHEFIDEVELRDGDQIKVGGTILKFISGGNIEGQYHETIYHLMTVDALTEVNNKRYFHEVLDKESSRSKRYDRSFSIVLFDIDHFKKINDSFGHLAGDAVLRQLGAIVKSHVRRDDTVARIGGEEFAILLPEINLAQAKGFAEKIRKLVEKSVFMFEDTEIDVTISLGVAHWSKDLDEPEQILRIADEKLYAAKRAGRNCSRG